MSGVVGMINLSGAPLERQLLSQMTMFMTYRGPDSQDIWIDGHVGFGNTLLKTTLESAQEKQPYSLDGQVWITADARIDGRSELVQELKSKGREISEPVDDAALILHAYHVWAEECVKHLIGDFAFAIWDGKRQRLFCARDHFGVKPFFYTYKDGFLLFSNTLNCIRIHSEVSDKLNDLAIADFLLFDYNQEPNTTVFVDIQRLPAGHYLTWSRGNLRVSRYWSLPTDGYIRFKRSGDYVDHFKEVFGTAVKDRLRSQRIGILMSGGVDSTAIAATVHQIRSKQSPPFDVHAFTTVYDKLIPDQERHYSGLVAQALGIPIHYFTVDSYALYKRWDEAVLHMPEPIMNPFRAISIDQYQKVASYSQGALTGFGGDPLLYSTQLVDLVKGLSLGHLMLEVGKFVMSYRRLPPLGLRGKLKSWLGKSWRPPYPTWLNKDFERRLNLKERWEKMNSVHPSLHPLRSKAYEMLTQVLWPVLFESCDPGMTSCSVELRHPFFDLRLVNYLLSIPPLPWFVNKELVRISMRGALPESVRLRPKAPLAGNLMRERLRQPSEKWIDDFNLTQDLAQYVERSAIPRVVGEEDSDQAWLNIRPLTLNYWLKQQSIIKQDKTRKEKCYEIA